MPHLLSATEMNAFFFAHKLFISLIVQDTDMWKFKKWYIRAYDYVLIMVKMKS